MGVENLIHMLEGDKSDFFMQAEVICKLRPENYKAPIKNIVHKTPAGEIKIRIERRKAGTLCRRCGNYNSQ